MKDKEGLTIWNVLLLKVEKGYLLMMPNQKDGTFKNVRYPKEGFLISWPVNPHFTGREVIIMMLENSGKFKETIY